MKSDLIDRILKRQALKDPDSRPHEKLVEFAAIHFATDFPNPGRIDCPPADSLSEIVNRGGLPSEETREHLLGCSECFKYYQDEVASQRVSDALVFPDGKAGRSGLRRRLVPIFVLSLTAIVSLSIVVLWISQNQSKHPDIAGNSPAPSRREAGAQNLSSRSEASEMPEPSGVKTKNLDPGAKKLGNAMVAKNTVNVDLELYSALRDGAGKERLRLPLSKGQNEVVIRLPLGSPKGLYRVDLTDPHGKTVRSANATSFNGQSLIAHLDLSLVKPGKYLLCVTRNAEVPDCVPTAIESSLKTH